MTLVLFLFVVLLLLLLVVLRRRQRGRERRLLETYTIDVEDLHSLLQSSSGKLRVFDVRLPLELLAHSEIIPGSERIAPKEILANPLLIPRDEDTVVYCTCAADASARDVVQKALKMGFTKARILRGGLEAWKAKGYPVERYDTAFRLDTPV